MRILQVLFLSLSFVFCQDLSVLTGTVTDKDSGKALVGVNIIIEDSDNGTASDLNGSYTIFIQPGEVVLNVSYIGYKSERFSIGLIEGQNNFNIALSINAVQLSGVEVTGQAVDGSDISMMIDRKESSNVEDAISLERMSKAGDSNAADAFRRVTGVSVVDNIVAVRGLGDRYTNTQLNNSDLATPEPEKRAVPLDLFSISIISGLSAKKTFTPDLPGTFAGGVVNIKTLAYPDRKIMKLKFGAGTISSIDNSRFRTSNNGINFFGIDGNDNKMPDVPKDFWLSEFRYPLTSGSTNPQNYTSSQWRELLSINTNKFKQNYRFKSKSTSPQISFGVENGQKFNSSNGNYEYGYFINYSFGNSYDFEDENIGRYYDNTTLSRYLNLQRETSIYNANHVLNMSTGLKYLQDHKFKLSFLFSHKASDKLSYSSGVLKNLEDAVSIQHYYSEKSLSNLSLEGNSIFYSSNPSELDWSINLGSASLYEPDVASHTYSRQSTLNPYTVDVSSTSPGLRFWADGDDTNNSLDLSYKVQFENFQLKSGLRIQQRDRTFKKRIFYYTHSTGTWPNNILEVNDNDFGRSFDEANFFDGNSGLIIVEEAAQLARAAYNADEKTNAIFSMIERKFDSFDIPITFIGGIRYEMYTLDLRPYNTVTGQTYVNPYNNPTQEPTLVDIDENYVLPSINFILDTSKDSKVRFSLSQTVARAEFREYAPLEYQAFYGDDQYIGVPTLEQSEVTNFDLRYEAYPSVGEVWSVSLFAKDMQKPVEEVLLVNVERSYSMYNNAKSAEIYGLEFDIRKKINLFPSSSATQILTANATLSSSDVEVNDFVVSPFAVTPIEDQTNRPLMGHSEFLGNLSLDTILSSGYEISLSYNGFSERIIKVGDVTGHYFEAPFHSLNFTSKKKFENGLSVSVKAKNLLNSNIKHYLKTDTGNKLDTKMLEPGISISLSMTYDFN